MNKEGVKGRCKGRKKNKERGKGGRLGKEEKIKVKSKDIDNEGGGCV